MKNNQIIKVLLIEDNLGDVNLIKEYLNLSTTQKYSIIVANRLYEAIESLGNEVPDIILLDLGLPDSKGIEDILKFITGLSNIPVIIQTGTADEETAVMFVNAGVQDYLVKGSINSFVLTRAISYAIERKQMNLKLQESEEKFRNLVENTNDIIWETDNNIYTYINPRVEAILGYKQNEIIGISPFDLMSPDEAAKIKILSNKIIASKGLFDGLININLHKNGTPVIFETCGVPVFNSNNELIGYCGINRDITERKKIESELIQAKEKAEESERLKTAFLANMSHEIRTPMNSINGYSDFLVTEHLSLEEQKEYALIINKSTKRLLNLINNILDISKIESGQMNVQFGNFNVNNQMRELFDLNINFAKNNNTNLEYSLDLPDHQAIFYSSETAIFHILTNFISNAFKYTNSGKVIFGYNIVDNNLLLFVKDSGAGISKEYLPNIFTRFSQENSSLSRKHEGAGLGLSIAKGLSDLINGTIYVESELTLGSTFFLKIPIVNHQKKTTDKIEVLSKFKTDLSTAIILIVEDDEPSFKLLKKQILRETSVNIIHAENGFVAISEIKKNRNITCVLMDLHLPIMDGFTTTKNIKEINKFVPVIAVSAAVMISDQDKAMASGCDAFFSKPIEVKKLIALIAEYHKSR